jgi:anti-sigma28 factor (negative regulator of flagellin synthesis)
MRSQQERERRVDELRALVRAGLYETDPDRLARAIVKASRRKFSSRLDGKPCS